MAWRGVAWHGVAWHGMAWRGMAIHPSVCFASSSPRCHHHCTLRSLRLQLIRSKTFLVSSTCQAVSLLPPLHPSLLPSLFTFNFTHHRRRWCRCCTALHDTAFVLPSLPTSRNPHESARIVHTTCAEFPEEREGGAGGWRAICLLEPALMQRQLSSTPPPRTRSSRVLSPAKGIATQDKQLSRQTNYPRRDVEPRCRCAIHLGAAGYPASARHPSAEAGCVPRHNAALALSHGPVDRPPYVRPLA